jgi:hypothetical protein
MTQFSEGCGQEDRTEMPHALQQIFCLTSYMATSELGWPLCYDRYSYQAHGGRQRTYMEGIYTHEHKVPGNSIKA